MGSTKGKKFKLIFDFLDAIFTILHHPIMEQRVPIRKQLPILLPSQKTVYKKAK